MLYGCLRIADEISDGSEDASTSHKDEDPVECYLSPQSMKWNDKETQKGNANRATLAVARKLVAYLLAVAAGTARVQLSPADGVT